MANVKRVLRLERMDDRYLFRGKRLGNGEWVVGWYAECSLYRGTLTPCIIQSELARSGESCYVEVDPSTVSQYTGLTDKHGTKIFEGDILSENSEHFIVVYDTKWAKFKLRYTHAIQYPEWNRGVLMEVIGNRWDTPRLMGGEQ